MFFKKLAVGAAIAALPLSLVALPAQAAGLGEPLIAATTPVNVVTSRTVYDGGEQEFLIKATWGHTYKDGAGNFRVTLSGFSVNAVGENLDDEGIDARLRVYSGRPDGTVNKIQDVVWDGADDPITLNPKNPLNYDGVTKIVITRVGVDGDGLPGAASVTIKQPVIASGIAPS